MIFLAPMWLLLAAPWLALAIWMMWGRRSATRVPFLDLWRGSVARPAATRLFRPPPLAIIALLATMLLGILAAAQPMVVTNSHEAPPVTVVLDRGVTMSASDRRAEVIEAAEKMLRQEARSSPIRVIAVPPTEYELTWPVDAKAERKTAIDTTDVIGPAVVEALRSSARVLVLSDHAIHPDPRVVAIAPMRTPSNIGIVRFSIRERPALQAMVAIRNDSTESRAELAIDGETRGIELPQRGETKNYFIDLPKVGATSNAQIAVNDEFDLDNVAWLTRQRDWPRIEMFPPLPREVQRVLQAYEKARPAGEMGTRVIVTASPKELAAEQPAVIVAAAGKGAPIDAAALKVVDHPITRNVNWSSASVRAIEHSADPTFTPIVSTGSGALIAITESPVRRVRVTFDAGDFALTPDFVILWTNILDWLGDASGQTFASKSMRELDLTWKPKNADRPLLPGLYERSDGATAAFNAPAPRFPAPPGRQSMGGWDETASASANRIKLLPGLVLAALCCTAVAAYAWPRQRLTPVFNPRTV